MKTNMSINTIRPSTSTILLQFAHFHDLIMQSICFGQYMVSSCVIKVQLKMKMRKFYDPLRQLGNKSNSIEAISFTSVPQYNKQDFCQFKTTPLTQDKATKIFSTTVLWHILNQSLKMSIQQQET